MKTCLLCNSNNLKKKGFYKSSRGKHRRYQCKDCLKTFSSKVLSPNYRKRKQHLRDKITQLYCERMSLRGIARVLNIDIKTVVKYFLENADIAKMKHSKRLHDKDLVTSYIQLDELHSHVQNKLNPVGIQITVRPKNGEIISAKVGDQWSNAPRISPKDKSLNESRKETLTDCMIDTEKVLNRNHASLHFDGGYSTSFMKSLLNNKRITLIQNSKQNKSIDRIFNKMRQDISRLSRKSLCISKKKENLQKHLDLYIDYSNKNRIY